MFFLNLTIKLIIHEQKTKKITTKTLVWISPDHRILRTLAFSWISVRKDPPNFFFNFWLRPAKTRQLGWKKRLKTSKIAKFETDLLKTIEDVAPQSSEIFRSLYAEGHVRNVC